MPESFSPPPATTSAMSQRRERIAAALYWLGAGAALVWLVVTWISGKLNATNLLVMLAVSVSLGAFGMLTLSGDITTRARDEGQEAAAQAAQASAFFVAYFGVIGLWMAYLFFPGWQAGATTHLGMLYLLILSAWLGVWIWRRWRG